MCKKILIEIDKYSKERVALLRRDVVQLRFETSLFPKDTFQRATVLLLLAFHTHTTMRMVYIWADMDRPSMAGYRA